MKLSVCERTASVVFRWTQAAILLCVLVFPAPSQAQSGGSDVNAEALYALQQYLDANCAVSGGKSNEGQVINSLDSLLRFKDVPIMQTRLMEILGRGPDQQSLEKTRRNLKKQWALVVAYRDAHPPKPALRAAAPPPMTEQAYVQARLERHARQYREKAAIALVIIGADTKSGEIKQALDTAHRFGDRKLQKAIDAARARFSGK